jgi:hypothetical protein
MLRLWVLILPFSLIAFAFQSALADLDPQANGLPGGLIIRRQAKDFDTMVRQTKPDFVWNGTDMLWITQDASGKLGFTMDHAYTVQLTGRRDKTCCLFDCDGYALGNEGCDGPAYPFTHESDAKPVKAAHDLKWGTVYQARWRDVGDMGSGCNRDTRNIFLLCDNAQHWRFLGDGPIANSHQDGASDSTVDTVRADVRWTGDAANPAELSFTLLSAHAWEPDLRTTISLTVRRKMVLTPGHSLLNAYERDSYRQEGPYYVIAAKSEPLPSFAAKVTHCWGLDLGVWGLTYGDAKLTAGTTLINKEIENSLLRIDPSLAGGIKAGAKIVMPDKLNKSDVAARDEWLQSQPQSPVEHRSGP